MEKKDQLNQEIYEKMKANKSLEPIAELVRLVMVAKNTAEQAKDIGDRLSVFACRAESAKEDLPPVAAWMKLCDKYKDGARAFAALLNEAIEASQINDLEENMKEYTQEVVEKTAWLVENDKEFRRMFEKTMSEKFGTDFKVFDDDDDDDDCDDK